MEVAIVEDTREDLDRLTECLNRYQKENNVALHITAYSNGVVFLENKNVYDIIFMDIKMPYLSGMETAKKWRALGEDSCLIFRHKYEAVRDRRLSGKSFRLHFKTDKLFFVFV